MNRPQIGMQYRTVVNSTLTGLSWAASLAGKVINVAFTPTAGMVELFDEFRVISARLRLMFNTATPSDVSYGHSHGLCYDPSGVAATLADYDAVMRYRNSDTFYLTTAQPVHEYVVNHLTHMSSDGVTLLDEAIKTEATWTAGAFYVAPADGPVTETVRIQIEYVVEYSKPRATF
jgi:hypothetical protein